MTVDHFLQTVKFTDSDCTMVKAYGFGKVRDMKRVVDEFLKGKGEYKRGEIAHRDGVTFFVNISQK